MIFFIVTGPFIDDRPSLTKWRVGGGGGHILSGFKTNRSKINKEGIEDLI